MKFLHLADLHLGKRLSEFSLLDDQKYILNQILQIVEERRPDAVVLAGDIYDKSAPDREAVALADDFLTRLAGRTRVLAVSGNHDSPERLAFGAALMRREGVHLARPFGGAAERVTLTDGFGPVTFVLMPFVRPADLRRFFREEDADPAEPPAKAPDFSALYRRALGEPEPGVRTVAVAHQLVSGAALFSDSETLSVGGAEALDPAVFAGYDYAALGHLHREQRAGGDHIRYSGSPLKYSFSEAGHSKCALLVTLEGGGLGEVERLPLLPRRDLRELTGSMAELLRAGALDPSPEDYLRITLTDDFVADAMAKLRTVYPNTMQLGFRRGPGAEQLTVAELRRQRDLFDWFCEFYEQQNGSPLEGEPKELARRLLSESEKEEQA